MRLGLMVLALAGLIGVVAVSATWQADAQGDDSDLRTQVADLQTRVAALETAVAGGSVVTVAAGENLLQGTVLLISGGRGDEVQRLGGFLAGDPCEGRGGFADLRAGAPVIVANEAGTVIATGEITAGALTDNYSCLFGFLVIGIPDAAFYSITIGSRPVLTYSRAELDAADWWLNLSLG
jgi:hypothetical protein